MSFRTHKSTEPNPSGLIRGTAMLLCIPLALLGSSRNLQAQTSKPAQAVIIEIEGTVETSAPAANTWKPVRVNQALEPGARVQTRQNSRAVIRLTDLSLLRLGKETLVEIPSASANPVLKFLKGVLYYFHRDKPGVLPVRTPTAYAVVIGTEFAAAVDNNGATELYLIDGRVDFSNDLGHAVLKSGQGASAGAGLPPVLTA